MKPPAHDVLGTHVEAFTDVLYPDEMVLPAMLASVRFGCGLELWPEPPARKEVRCVALS